MSFPAVLNAMLTSVSSMFPETTIRLSGGRFIPRYAYTAAPARTSTIKIKKIRFFIGFSSASPRPEGEPSLHRTPRPTHRLRQVDPRHVVPVNRRGLVVASPFQPRLRVRHFDAVGDPRVVPPPRLRQLVFRQVQAFARHLHLILRRLQRVQRQPHVQLNLFP